MDGLVDGAAFRVILVHVVAGGDEGTTGGVHVVVLICGLVLYYERKCMFMHLLNI